MYVCIVYVFMHHVCMYVCMYARMRYVRMYVCIMYVYKHKHCMYTILINGNSLTVGNSRMLLNVMLGNNFLFKRVIFSNGK
jgi:hypothetical protein